MINFSQQDVLDAEAAIKAAVPEVIAELYDYDFALAVALPDRHETVIRVCGVHRFENDPPTFFANVDDVIVRLLQFKGSSDRPHVGAGR